MKASLKKRTIYLAIGSTLLLGCFELKNVGVIVDGGAALGYELDLSKAEIVCRICRPAQPDADVAATTDKRAVLEETPTARP